MGKYISSAVVFIVAAMTVSSCLGNGTEVEYYEDAAITSFSLDAVNRYVYTKAKDGSDSIYKTAVNISGYTFSIDQEKALIWNSDSLPLHTEPKAVLVTIGAKNGGSVGIKSMTSDSLTAYKSTDSINFSKPREFYVYNVQGTGYRKYTVTLNVHQEAGDSCVWTKVASGNSQLAALTDIKAIAKDNSIYVFGNANGTAKTYVTATTDGAVWTELTSSHPLSATASSNTLLRNGVFYCLTDGTLLSSPDAYNWQVVAETTLRRLIAATTMRLYAIDGDGTLVSSTDNGVTWTAETLDTDAAYFPTEGFSYACHTLRTDANAEKVVLIGNRSLDSYPEDKFSMVWTKIDENKAGSRTHSWVFNNPDPAAKYNAPRANNWQIVNYDATNIKALCGSGIGKSSVKALDNVFHSGDDGITWLKDSIMYVPEALQGATAPFATTVDNNNSVWVVCGGTGNVWKTRINRLVWKKEDAWKKE